MTRAERGGAAQYGEIGVERDAAGADLADGIGPRPDPAHGPRARVRDGEDRVREHREQRRVRQGEVDLHRSLVRREDLPDDAGRSPQETGRRRVRRRSQRVAGHDDAVEALRHVARGERGAVVEADAVPDAESPLEPVAGDDPRGRQPRLHVARPLAVLDERVEDLARDQGHGTIESRGRIQRGGNGRHADPERDTLGLRASGCHDGGQYRQDQAADPAGHRAFISKRATRSVGARHTLLVDSAPAPPSAAHGAVLMAFRAHACRGTKHALFSGRNIGFRRAVAEPASQAGGCT